MIRSGFYLKGLLSVRSVDSPAIALGCSFLAIGALLKNIGFNFQQSFFSTFFTYALPGQLVMAESFLVGASLINIFIAVWLVNARLFPMAVSMFPLLKSKKQPKWKYYISCHFLAVSSWLIMKKDYKTISEDYRIDFWMGIGTATWSIAIFSTVLGYVVSDYLSKDMMIGLAIVNPIYFFLHVVRFNEKYCYRNFSYFRDNSWSCFLFNITRMVYFIWRSNCRCDCIFNWRV